MRVLGPCTRARSLAPSRARLVPVLTLRLFAVFASSHQAEDYVCAGIAPFGVFGDIMVLCHVIDDEAGAEERPPPCPELRVLTRTNEELSCDALTLKGFAECCCNGPSAPAPSAVTTASRCRAPRPFSVLKTRCGDALRVPRSSSANSCLFIIF